MNKSIIISGLLALASFSSQAGLINSSFETGDLSSWNSSGLATVDGTVNYGSAGSISPFDGVNAAHLMSTGATAVELASLMGITEVVLEDSNGSANATTGSMIHQSISNVSVGDNFTFSWNFVENDYLPFDDWAFYGISIDGGPAEVSKLASLGSVGPSAGTTINGWEQVSLDITQAGDYTFYFGIVNAVDMGINSDLWIDGVSIDTTPVPTPSTIAIFALGIIGLAARRLKIKS